MKKIKNLHLIIYIALILIMTGGIVVYKHLPNKISGNQKDTDINYIILINKNYGKKDFDRRADLNKDGKVDMKDLNLATQNYKGRIIK